jgi:hypothetical protein
MAVGKPRRYPVLVGSEATDPGSESKRSGVRTRRFGSGAMSNRRSLGIEMRGTVKRVLYGIRCRGYEEWATVVAEALGISGSTVSRRWLRNRCLYVLR